MKRTNILFKSFTAFIIALAMVSCEIDSFSEESQFEFGDIVAPSNLQMSAEVVGGGTGDGSGRADSVRIARRAGHVSGSRRFPPESVQKQPQTVRDLAAQLS